MLVFFGSAIINNALKHIDRDQTLTVMLAVNGVEMSPLQKKEAFWQLLRKLATDN